MEKKITPEFFRNPDERLVFEFIMSHHLDHGKVPDEDTILLQFPRYVVSPQAEPLEFYADRVRDDYLKELVTTGFTEILEDYDSKYLSAHKGGELLHEQLSELVINSRMEVPLGDDHDLFGTGWNYIKPQLDIRRKYGEVQGIPTGFPSFDRTTGGLQPERLITLIGIPKSGKSSLALRIALNAALSGARTCFVTFEMSNDEQRDRTASLMGKIPLTNILRGDLLPQEMKRLETEFSRLQNLSGFFTLIEDRSSMTTLDGIQGKITKFRPKFLVVDGAYMMEDQHGEPPGSPRALTNITRGLKRLAQSNGIPIMITTQALEHKSKGGLNSNSPGYSSSFAQDSDVLAGAERLPDAPEYSKFKTILSRTGPPTECFVHIGWNEGVIEEVPEALIPTAKPDPAANAPTGMDSY